VVQHQGRAHESPSAPRGEQPRHGAQSVPAVLEQPARQLERERPVRAPVPREPRHPPDARRREKRSGGSAVKNPYVPMPVTIQDVAIENDQCYRQAEIYSNILASLMDARVSIVSNNLNVLMKTLNIITLAIMVPTFVVSAFSMNVRIPLSGLGGAFWIIMGLAAVSSFGFILFGKLKKW
jgi:hypothetical protein